MTNRSSLMKLARFGAVAAASLTLAGLMACNPPATNTTTTNATTTTTVTPARTNAAMGLGNMGGPNSNPPGGLAPAPNGDTGNTGMAGPNGNTGGPNGNAGPGPMANNNNNNDSDAAGNQQWDRATYSSCVPSAMQQGASAGGASRYCACVVAQLDNLSLSQKEMLSPQSPELGAAVNACRPQAQGN